MKALVDSFKWGAALALASFAQIALGQGETSVESDPTAAVAEDGEGEVVAVRLRLTNSTLTADQIVEALGAEFRARVVPTEGIHGLHLDVDGRILHASYRDPGGDRIEREVELPQSADAQIETIALLAGNLARDEAGALLSQLRANQADIDAAEQAEQVEAAEDLDTEEAAPAGAPPQPEDPPGDRAEPPSNEEQAPEQEPKPIAEPELEQARLSASLTGNLSLPPNLDDKRVRAHLGALASEYGSLGGIDLTLGMSRNLGRGPTGSGKGVQLSVVFTRTDGAFRGLSGAALVATQFGPLKGAQGSAIVAYQKSETEGAQLSGVAAIALSDFRGAQLGGATSILWGDLEGVQAAGAVSLLRGDLDGLQAATGLAWTDGRVDGFQFAAVNVARHVDGGQIGAVNLGISEIEGFQAGMINYATKGATQIGMLNIGGDMSGSQIGLLNIAKDVDGIAVAPVNIIPGIRNQIVAYGSWAPNGTVEGSASSPLVHLGVKFMPEPFYTQLSFGVGAEAEECPGDLPAGDAQCIGNGVLYAPGFAAGFRIPIAGGLFSEIDAQYQFEKAFSQSSAHGHAILGRLALGYQFGPAFGVFVGGGPRADFRVGDGPDATFTWDGSPHVFGGIQIF